jgi:uncharacterized protein with HEPN domain
LPPTLGDRLTHILSAIEDIQRLLQSRTRSDFEDDVVLRMAVERLFEIISEASRYIPAELKASHSTIAWQRMADLRNWLRHAYHRIDADVLWNIAHNELGPLKRFVEEIVRPGRFK